ncbi:MAG: LPS export ABC transporter periplasmic protein LptC [Saprospiraceae bacterium]
MQEILPYSDDRSMGIRWSVFVMIGILLIVNFTACSNKEEDINDLLAENLQSKVETGKNIRIVYSDSAIVKAVIHAPVMERYSEYGNSSDVFPKGILLEFLDDNRVVKSWVKAETAVREEKIKKITARGNVTCYDDENKKIETSELIFDEIERTVYTDKLVRITNPVKGDTTYGFGFKANQDFTRFEIKKKVQGKLNIADIVPLKD